MLSHGGSLAGDSETLPAIPGRIAEAFYGVPEDLKQECRKRLTPDLEEILQACENMILQR
jgi:ADP-ribosylglycohydrolase